MASLRFDGIPRHVDGPTIVAASSGLMLLPSNASRNVRLHRLAALGMALEDQEAAPVSPSAVRSLLKRDDIGGVGTLMLEDQYSETLVQTVSFSGGPYLVSGGSGEHTVSDLENLIEAAFRDHWMPDDVRVPARQLIQGLLFVSDLVLRRAGLARGAVPEGSARTPMDVPGARRLKELTDATYVSNEDLDRHSGWLRMVVDTFALDPGQLTEPCRDDYTEDRLYVSPFLRLPDGYRVVLPLDLGITIRFHLLRFARQEGQLEELGRRWREAALRRFARLQPMGAFLNEIARDEHMTRYITKIDDKRDLHLIVATDPLVDLGEEVWGWHDTQPVLHELATLIAPDVRQSYSEVEELLHVVITDSPGRGAFWGVPNVDDADPVLISRSDDLEAIWHQEPDGALGLLLFAQAIARRPGESMSASVLDEYSSYVQAGKSFYLSDDGPSTFTAFQPGDGLGPRLKYSVETDRHGVAAPVAGSPIIQVQRRYERDAPEIFITLPSNSYVGSVVELGEQQIFVTIDLRGHGFLGVEPDLLDCVAYWIRECAILTAAGPSSEVVELTVALTASEAWTMAGTASPKGDAVIVGESERGFVFEFTESFVGQLQQSTNHAERELVGVLLRTVFGTAPDQVQSAVDLVAPLGPKRMMNVFNQDRSPDMLSARLPQALTGHDQVAAQLLDELGEWLRSPNGGRYAVGVLEGEAKVRILNAAVRHLFDRLETDVATFHKRTLLDFLVAQNESLGHSAKLDARLLPSRLACFGEHSYTVAELVERRREISAAHRANRFLIEYVAAQPLAGADALTVLDYYRLLSIARELIERATLSDFLHYNLADFGVSILESGRLGMERDQPVLHAMNRYAANSGARTVRDAGHGSQGADTGHFDGADFVASSEDAMRAEFGFTLPDLREVCGGLLEIAEADRVSRVARSEVVDQIARKRGMSSQSVSSVLDAITLTERSSFLSIGQDAFPWRFNRDMSYLRRPLVLDGDELTFGFRSVYRLGIYWADNILSGRLQGRAKTPEMRQFISTARGKVNEDFARSVASRLKSLGLVTRLSVKKLGKHHISDFEGRALGDIDVLAAHPETKSLIAVEAKDFEIARTPAEISNELEKLFSGTNTKKPTILLHTRRIDWLRRHVDLALSTLGIEGDGPSWRVDGVIVTSEPLIAPLVESSSIPVIPFGDLDRDILGLSKASSAPRKHSARRQRR